MTRTTRHALLFSIGGNYAALLVTTIGSIIATRLLQPAEVGSFVVAGSTLMLIEMVRDLNLGAYLVQSKDLDKDTLGSAIGLSIALSFILAALLWVSATSIGAALGNPAVAPLLRIMLLSFLIAPFSMLTIAHFQRQMQFRELLIFQICAAAGRTSVGVGLLLIGMGPAALAWGYVASKVGELVALVFSSSPHKLVQPSVRRWRPLLLFGFQATAADMVSNLSIATADLAIGRFIGPAAAGFYSRGALLSNFCRSGVQSAILPVAFAAFSRESRNPSGDIKAAYLRGMGLLTAAAWPLFAVLAALAEPTTLVLYGSNWASAVPIARILALAGAIYILFSVTGKLLVSLGKVSTLLKRNTAIQLPRILLVLVAAPFGISVVAWAVVFAFALSVVVDQIVLKEVTGITYTDMWNATCQSLAIASITGASAVIASSAGATLPMPLLSQLFVGGVIAFLTWLLAIHVFHHPIADEVRIMLQNTVFRSRTKAP